MRKCRHFRVWHEADMAGVVGDVRCFGVERKSVFGFGKTVFDPTENSDRLGFQRWWVLFLAPSR